MNPRDDSTNPQDNNEPHEVDRYEVDAAVAQLLTPDLPPRADEGDTSVDDLVQPSAANAPQLTLERRRRLLDVVQGELAIRHRNSGSLGQVLFRHRTAQSQSLAGVAEQAAPYMGTAIRRFLDDTTDGSRTGYSAADSPVEAHAVEALEREEDIASPESRALGAVVAALHGVPREAAQQAFRRSIRHPGESIAAERVDVTDLTDDEQDLLVTFSAVYDEVVAARRTQG